MKSTLKSLNGAISRILNGPFGAKKVEGPTKSRDFVHGTILLQYVAGLFWIYITSGEEIVISTLCPLKWHKKLSEIVYFENTREKAFSNVKKSSPDDLSNCVPVP